MGGCRRTVPMKAFGMVIFSHILSRTSSPDSGEAIALATVAMSLWMDRWKSSKPGGNSEAHAESAGGRTRRFPRRTSGDLRSVSGMELVMEELVDVMVLMEGLMP